ncbi:MAG TPA: response regulator [Bacteroidetes bacterium]|nr:response regulator [Bacteroidota bacterium]
MKLTKSEILTFLGIRNPAQKELSVHPVTLRFTGEMEHFEKDFLDDYFKRIIGPFRFSLLLAIIFYGSFAALDAIVIPELKYQFWFIRFVLVIPVILVLYILSYSRFIKNYLQPLVSVAMYLTGLGIIAMIIYASRIVERDTYYAGLILILIFGYAFTRIRFIYATLAGWLIVGTYEAAAIWLTQTPTEQLYNNNFFFISANIIGMFICYLMELSARRDYVMRHLLEEEQDKVKAANEMLEHRVQERTAQLTRTNRALKKEIEMRKHYEQEQAKLEAQLLQLQKIETIGTLAGGIAHDFNNILTPILGYTEMAMEELDEESTLRYDIEQINHAAIRGKDLVQQILTFSRQVEVEKKPLYLQEVIQEIMNLVKASFPSNIEIKMDLDPHCGTVLADTTQIHQVIMNLCTNAYHAMIDRGGILHVRLTEKEVDAEKAAAVPNLEKGNYVLVTISDTGHGMDHATMNRIFEPFFTKKEVGVGSGLGLSVVHGIVKSYKGAIEVESQPGKGSTFRIYLPRHGKGPSDLFTDKEVLEKGKETILFVDDEEEITYMGKKMLENLGYRVNIQTDTRKAVAEFEANHDKYDLLVTDQTMPHMLGTDMARQFRQIRPDLKVIIITGYSNSISSEMLEKEKIDELVLKPIKLSEFSKVIRRVLDKDNTAVM